MKLRPVRLAPCAAGASPMTTIDGRSTPKPGTGRPQYCWSANARRFVRATSSRQATNRGHARHTETRALSSDSADAEPASARTSPTSWATTVRLVALSPGQPVPGRTTMDDSVACPSRVQSLSTPSPETTWPRLAALWVGGSSRMRSASRLESRPEGPSRGSGRHRPRPTGQPAPLAFRPERHAEGGRHLDDDLRGLGWP